MPLYIEQNGDLERCHRSLTDRASQLLIKYKSGALVTQFRTDLELYNVCTSLYVCPCVYVCAHVCLHRASHMIWVRLWRTSDRTNASYRYRLSYPMAYHPIIQLMASTQLLMTCPNERILAKTKPQLYPPRFIISLFHKST